MSASGFTPIQLYRTSTAAATPSAGNLADGELAINLTDEKLYFKNASGVVKLLASNSGSLGSVTSVNASGSTTGLTFTGGPITSSGTLTLGGTLVVGNGGTGSNTAAGARTNLGVPANDGTGATGTWGINVTGNAGTVTNGVYTTGNQTIGGLKTFSSTIYLADGGFVFNSDGAKDTGMSWASDGVMNVVCNGVTVGQFNSTGFTGNAANVTGTVAVSKGGTGATSLTSGYLLKGNGTSAVSSSVVYDTGTNVGIGTAAPGYKLEVQGNVYAASAINADGGINIAAGLGAYWRASLPSGAYQGGITYNGALRFYSGDVTTERMRIDASGKVGIGTSSPDTTLDLAGSQVSRGDANGFVYFAPKSGTPPFGANYDRFEIRVHPTTQVTTLGNTNGGTGSPRDLAFTTSGSERMRIDTSGNVGIGTSSPTQKLTVSGGSVNADNFYIQTQGASQAGTVGFANANGPGIQFWGSSTGNAGSLTFNTVNTERMRVTSTGNVGIGTTSPGYKLVVNGGDFLVSRGSGATAADAAINFGGNANNYIYSGNSSNIMAFATNGSERARIDSSGNVGIGTSAPNAKLDVVGSVVMGAALTTGTGVSTGDVQVELGANRTGDGPCYVDWHSTAGTDFEARAIRNTGTNGSLDILNTGTGGINLSNFGSAPITLATGGIDRMRVTSTGNVGIGTTSPQARLHVRPTTDVNLWTTNDSTTLRTIAINDGVSAYINWRRDANQHTFETNGSERVRFSQTGNVGIGTTSPAQRIHAATTAAPTGTTQSFLRLTGDATFGADFGGGLIQGTGPIATISTVNAGTATERMRIDTNGNVGINETAPDYKLDVNGTFGFTPGSSVTPVDNGDVVFELTNNTTLTIKAKGSDGVVRSATITLA